MKLADLLKDFADYAGKADIEIRGLTLQSQQLQPQEVFIALKGSAMDGRAFIDQAIHQGASAILCEAQGFADFHYDMSRRVPVVPIKNLADQLEKLAKRFYGDASQTLEVIGITGTNGKTTTSFLLAQALSRLAVPCAVIGTMGYGFTAHLETTGLTTPDTISLHKYFKALATQGAQAVAMEVSSHGLAQGRVSRVNFISAIFTNLTQDHLDYHGTMDAYGKAKQKLFQFSTLKRAILNADSDYTEKFLRVIRRDIPVVLYSLNKKLTEAAFAARPNTAFIFAQDIHLDQKGIVATVQTPWGQGQLRSSLLGEFNLRNLLAVLAELCLRKVPLNDALHALHLATAAPGRMQRFGGVRSPQVIVDYAHTPDALENALKAARLHCRRRLWCVFGCGGDRDKDKRAKMGDIASRFADRLVITNDNPRSESPQQIIQEILQGVGEEAIVHTTIEEDRQQAIEYAINHALAVDTILVAGKGHEDYQIIGNQKLPFSDAECVKALLNEEGANEVIVTR